MKITVDQVLGKWIASATQGSQKFYIGDGSPDKEDAGLCARMFRKALKNHDRAKEQSCIQRNCQGRQVMRKTIGMIEQQKVGLLGNWHYEWIIRTVERMEELKQRGERDVTLHIEEFQRILRELLYAMHQRSDRLEDVLCSYARYAFPVNQKIEPPAMFGGAS